MECLKHYTSIINEPLRVTVAYVNITSDHRETGCVLNKIDGMVLLKSRFLSQTYNNYAYTEILDKEINVIRYLDVTFI